MSNRSSRAWSMLLFGVMLILTGCGEPYVMRGRVIEGDFSMAAFVADGDSRMRDVGVPGARVELIRDPTKLNREVVATGTSDGDGWLDFTLDAFGAGWMDEQWEVRVSRRGFETVATLIRLPRKKDERRLLVVMSPGFEAAPMERSDELWEQYEKFR